MNCRIPKAPLLTLLMAMFAEVVTAATQVAANPACADVALVLSVDGSTSVSPGEFALQRSGIANAFRDPHVLHAIAQSGTFVVSAVFWGSDGTPTEQTAWFVIKNSDDANAFASMIEGLKREVSGDTGLAAGISASLDRLTAPGLCATRRIINVSGDGEESKASRGTHRSLQLSDVKERARSLGIEINALSITNEDEQLTQYFKRNVITGPYAFVMSAPQYGDFSEALRQKLIREISPKAVSALAQPPRG